MGMSLQFPTPLTAGRLYAATLLVSLQISHPSERFATFMANVPMEDIKHVIN